MRSQITMKNFVLDFEGVKPMPNEPMSPAYLAEIKVRRENRKRVPGALCQFCMDFDQLLDEIERLQARVVELEADAVKGDE